MSATVNATRETAIEPVVARHTSISEDLQFAGAVDGDVGTKGKDDSESEYFYSLKVCGVNVISIMTNNGGKYITKIFGLDVIIPLLLLCIFMLHVRILAELLVIVFWVFVFLQFIGDKKGDQPYNRSANKAPTRLKKELKREGEQGNCSSVTNADEEGIVSKELNTAETTTLRRRTLNKDKIDGYQSDDGEVIEVLGGF